MRGLFELTDQVAVITGASSGFGARFAKVLADYGAIVALVARREDRLREVYDSIMQEAHGRLAGVYVADVSDTGCVDEVFDQIEGELGTPTILINNAGIGHADKAVDITMKTFDEVLAVDLRAPMIFAQEFARRLITVEGSGCIVNVSSTFGLMAGRGLVAYGAAKGGLIHMTKCLALEWAAHSIRVNALCPGWHVTDMTREYLSSPRGMTIAADIPLKRFGQPDDLDGAMLLLASDAGRYITGTTLIVDGGMSMALRDGHSVKR